MKVESEIISHPKFLRLRKRVGIGAMEFLGWPKCWVIVWFNTEEDFRQDRLVPD